MPRTPRSSRRAAAASTSTGSASNSNLLTPASAIAVGTMAMTEPRLLQIHDEATHDGLAAAQHDNLVLEKLENLRSLVKEIKQDDWKYNAKERLPAHVTKGMAWKQPTVAPTRTPIKTTTTESS